MENKEIFISKWNYRLYKKKYDFRLVASQTKIVLSVY